VIYESSPLAVLIFCLFVGFTLGLSFWLGRKAKSSEGYFAAHGQIPWFVNGVAFAGDYLSAASFLGICGMIAFYGYDGFLYSIGYLAGWIVALFVIAEPVKRLGRYTLADALNARFQSRGVKLVAAVATLVISLFYLVPQMVGAGALVKPLLGLPHWAGVALVGVVVTAIVATAGMVSTTWVQFIKGALLVGLCTLLVGLILGRGLEVRDPGPPRDAPARDVGSVTALPAWAVPGGEPGPDGMVRTEGARTGPLGPVEFLRVFSASEVAAWRTSKVPAPDGTQRSVAAPERIQGNDLLLPGNSPTFRGLRSGSPLDRVDFVSLMVALFLGTASLPHILIRYYTVRDAAAARKSTVVGIGAIGIFYLLTLYLGIGAMTSGALDPTDSNMAAPLLARTFGETLFAVVSAVAFTTVLGTVSGLVIAGAGAVVYDLLRDGLRLELDDSAQVKAGRAAAVLLGAGAIALGVLFEGVNVSFLVGWAFNVAASANLPALVMLLFWRRTTKEGVIAAMAVGLVSSLGWILASPDTLEKLFGYSAADAAAASPVPFSQPAIATVPLGFAVLVCVSLMTSRRAAA